jgi:hypothetical protein
VIDSREVAVSAGLCVQTGILKVRTAVVNRVSRRCLQIDSAHVRRAFACLGNRRILSVAWFSPDKLHAATKYRVHR